MEIILWKFVLRLYSCTRPMIPRFTVVASNATPLSSFLEAGAISLTTHILYIDIQVVSQFIIVLPLLSSKYIREWLLHYLYDISSGCFVLNIQMVSHYIIVLPLLSYYIDCNMGIIIRRKRVKNIEENKKYNFQTVEVNSHINGKLQLKYQENRWNFGNLPYMEGVKNVIMWHLYMRKI